jgi:hypothetical protein
MEVIEMTLTWKDSITTALAAMVAGFTYLQISGYHFPFISGYRWAIGVLLVLGIGMCAFGSTASANYSSPYVMTASILGGLSLILIVAGLIMGTKTMFLAVAGIILLLWAVATFRHLLGA